MQSRANGQPSRRADPKRFPNRPVPLYGVSVSSTDSIGTVRAHRNVIVGHDKRRKPRTASNRLSHGTRCDQCPSLEPERNGRALFCPFKGGLEARLYRPRTMPPLHPVERSFGIKEDRFLGDFQGESSAERLQPSRQPAKGRLVGGKQVVEVAVFKKLLLALHKELIGKTSAVALATALSQYI